MHKLCSCWNQCTYSEAELLTILEGARQQWTREVLFLLEKPNFKLPDELLTKMLTDTFGCPVTTKPYTEDIFRDLRTKFKNVPVNKVTPWVRQYYSHESMDNRDKDKIIKMVTVRWQTQKQFQNLKKKKLLTAALFSPPTNPQKLKLAKLVLSW